MKSWTTKDFPFQKGIWDGMLITGSRLGVFLGAFVLVLALVWAGFGQPTRLAANESSETSPTVVLASSPGASTLSVTAADAQTEVAAAVASPPKPWEEPITTDKAFRGILILILFITIASLIATRRLPAMIALPIMAIGIGMCVGMPMLGPGGVLGGIVEGFEPDGSKPRPSGAFRLFDAIIYILFGGMFARFITDAKIAERIVKFAAEFGGENPYLICLMMALINAIIFTAGGGLPIIIMVGTVMFPILLSLGVSPVVCGCLLLLSFPIGTFLSPANWALQAGIFRVTLEQSITFHALFALIMGVVLVVFLTYEFLTMKRGPVSRSSVLASLGILISILALIGGAVYGDRYLLEHSKESYEPIRQLLGLTIQSGLWGLLALGVIDSLRARYLGGSQIFQWNLLTPLTPLLLLLIMGYSSFAESGLVSLIVPAFITAIAYGVVTTPGHGKVQRLSRTIMDGIADVAAPVVLLLGIGMLIAAATHPDSRAIIQPLLGAVIPTTAIGFLIFFFFLSPLSLYRGPLNQFGLGAGLAQIMREFLPAGAVLGAIVSVGMLPDPTTSQNVWTTGYLKISINAILFKLFFYSIVMMICGLLLAVALFFPGGLSAVFGGGAQSL